jgi:hypothetical protein
MVPVRRVRDQFEAQVLVARLGAAGVVAQLRGAGVDAVYPMGSIEILVPEEELSFAAELLASPSEPPPEEYDDVSPTSVRRWHVVTAMVVVAMLFLTVIARLLGG